MGNRLVMGIRAREKDLLTGLALFMLFFFVLACYLPTVPFSDESDNFIGGMVIANGGRLYVDHTSQHMPFTYYLCALFHLLGAKSIVAYRLFFDGFLSALWVTMFFRYRKQLPQMVLILYPVAYGMMMAWYSIESATVISDHLQAQGMVILLIEFYHFLHTRKIAVGNCVLISLAIVLSFGTTFVSAYSVAVMAFTVLGVEIQDYRALKRKWISFLPTLWRKYWKMLVIVIAPFALLILYYALIGTLRDFYRGAYWINRDIYPKYIYGYGSSSIAPLFTILKDYATIAASALIGLSSTTMDGFRFIILVVANFWFAWHVFRKNRFAGFAVFYYTAQCAPRGFVGFHSMGYYAVSLLMLLLLFAKLAHRKCELYKLTAFALATLSLIVLTYPYFSLFGNYLTVPAALRNREQSAYAAAISQVTDAQDKIYITDIQNATVYIEADRTPLITAPSSTPWTYEAFKSNELKALEDYRPKVAIVDQAYEVWGYRQADYAPEVVRFIEQNYTRLDTGNTPHLYVRNDYAAQAREKLGIGSTNQ